MTTRSKSRLIGMVLVACLVLTATPASATGVLGYGRITSMLINIGPIEIEYPKEPNENPCEHLEGAWVDVSGPKAPVGTGQVDNIEVVDLTILSLFKDPFTVPPMDWYQLSISLTDPLDAIYDQKGDLNEVSGPKDLEVTNLEVDVYFEIWTMPNVKDEEAEEPCERGDLICFGWVGFPDLEGGYHPDDYPTDILPGYGWIEGESDEFGVITNVCSQPFTQISDEIVEISELQVCFKDASWSPNDPDCI